MAVGAGIPIQYSWKQLENGTHRGTHRDTKGIVHHIRELVMVESPGWFEYKCWEPKIKGIHQWVDVMRISVYNNNKNNKISFSTQKNQIINTYHTF